jgi:magnesium chelatase family protein
MLDRVDIFIDVPRVDYEKLVQPPGGETSEMVRERVELARQVQRRRFAGTTLSSNADMGPQEVWEHCQVEHAARSLLQMSMNQFGFSARGFHRVLKVARTIADLAGSGAIQTVHLGEALQYRARGVA